MTRDHVISKNLFPDGYNKQNLITVPACSDCNTGYSQDEELFRLFLANCAGESSTAAMELIYGKITRSMQRAPGKAFNVMKSMEPVLVPTAEGTFKQMAKLHITTEDWKRYHRVLDKYVAGLFFLENGIPLPTDIVLVHNLITDAITLPEETLSSLKWNLDHSEVYSYGHAQVPDTYEGVCMFVFFNNITFLTFVLTPDHVAEFELVRNVPKAI